MTGTIWQCTWTSVDTECYTEEEEWADGWIGKSLILLGRVVVLGDLAGDVDAWNVLVGGKDEPDVAYLYDGRLVLGLESGDTEWQQVEAE